MEDWLWSFGKFFAIMIGLGLLISIYQSLHYHISARVGIGGRFRRMRRPQTLLGLTRNMDAFADYLLDRAAADKMRDSDWRWNLGEDIKKINEYAKMYANDRKADWPLDLDF